MHNVSRGTWKYMSALKYSHKVVADDSVDSYTLKIKWKSLFWTSQVWLNVINLSGIFGSGCQEPFKKLNQCNKKRERERKIFFRDFENLQDKNEWQQLIIYLIDNVGLEGPFATHSERKKKTTRWDMFSPFTISFTGYLHITSCPCDSTLPNKKSKGVNETSYQYWVLFFSFYAAEFWFPYKSYRGFVIQLLTQCTLVK